MSTANKLTYLNGTKQAIKQAINEDFEVIDNNTTFREYADEISSNNAKYKDLIPKETKNATNTLDISNSAGLDKALVTQYGNTYQDGEPTPDAPVEIQVVSGDNTINICGKNLISNIDIFNGYPTGNNGGTIGYNISVNSITYKKCCYVIAGQEYTLSWKINTVKAVGYRDIKIVDNNNIILENFSYSNANNNRTKTFTPTKSGWIYAALDTNATEVQIEKGPIASEYVGLLGTTYPINLGSIELCKIGNYKDRIYPLNGKWYLEKKIGKVVFNGTEGGGAIYDNGQRFGYTSNNVTEIANALINTPTSVSNLTPIYSNRFTSSTQNGVTPTSNTIGFSQWGTTKYIYLSAIESTVADYKNWLSNNNVEVYFPLATPTTTEITESNYPTLYNQLNNIKLFEGVNHITMTNESGLDVEFGITYYKDWKLD